MKRPAVRPLHKPIAQLACGGENLGSIFALGFFPRGVVGAIEGPFGGAIGANVNRREVLTGAGVLILICWGAGAASFAARRPENVNGAG